MNTPHVAAGWQQAWSRTQWQTEISTQAAEGWSLPCLVRRDDEPIGYVELYRVAAHPLGARYPVLDGDLGVHVAIGEQTNTGRGIGTELLTAVADGLLAAAPECTRVVAEPDVTNIGSVRAFGKAGFRRVGDVQLPKKTAALMVRPRTEADLPVLPATPGAGR